MSQSPNPPFGSIDLFQHLTLLSDNDSFVGIAFADDRCVDIVHIFIVMAKFHLVYRHRNAMRNLICQQTKCFFTDQLCYDLTHRLINSPNVNGSLAAIRELFGRLAPLANAEIDRAVRNIIQLLKYNTDKHRYRKAPQNRSNVSFGKIFYHKDTPSF